MILVATALAVSAPLAVGISLIQTTYLDSVRAKQRLKLAIYTANGVPSILFGIFGLILFGQVLGWGKSWLAGGLVLAAMILPTLTVALVERIEALPGKYSTAAAATGLTRSQIIRSVILPQTRNGLLVGALLGLARAAGETAPIMFTAAVFSGATLPSGIRESPILALPYHIFVLAQDSFDPAAHSQMWGAAVVLLGLVMFLSLMALPARLRSAEEAHHG
jgi:phosphate transport system permease protein